MRVTMSHKYPSESVTTRLLMPSSSIWAAALCRRVSGEQVNTPKRLASKTVRPVWMWHLRDGIKKRTYE